MCIVCKKTDIETMRKDAPQMGYTRQFRSMVMPHIGKDLERVKSDEARNEKAGVGRGSPTRARMKCRKTSGVPTLRPKDHRDPTGPKGGLIVMPM